MKSLIDGSVIQEHEFMHQNFITQFLANRDLSVLVTCGKDKQIKIWDWIKHSQKLCLFLEESVDSLIFSLNQELLFAGTLDKKITIISMRYLSKVSELKCSFEVRCLSLSPDGDFLVASSSASTFDPKKVYYWPLEFNPDSFRLPLSMEGVTNSYVTPNHDYLAIATKEE